MSTDTKPNPMVANVSAERWKEITTKYPHFPTKIMELTEKRRDTCLRLPASIEDWLASTCDLVKDPRDGIMISLILNMTLTTLPLYGLLWVYPSHKLGLFTLLFTIVMWNQRFILMKHYAEHQKVFCPWLAWYVNVVLSTLLGIPPGLYALHHNFMHHIGNNVLGDDLSATEHYQRDNFFQWLGYSARHFQSPLTLPLYALGKRRYDMVATSLVGAILWHGSIYVVWSQNTPFALYALVLPYIITGNMMMFGNFSQHIFVDPKVATMTDKHGYKFNSAITYQSINHIDNLVAFNDGYHVTHHVNSRIHWTRHVEHFLTNLEKYAENDTLVFDGLGFFDIGLFTMIGRLDILADHLVQFTKEKKKKEEIIAELQRRLKPVIRKDAKAL